MAETAKNILFLNNVGAMNFFIKSEQTHGFELLEYFTFEDVMKFMRDAVGDTPYVQKSTAPYEPSDMNLDTLLNKDERYVDRPHQRVGGNTKVYVKRRVNTEIE